MGFSFLSKLYFYKGKFYSPKLKVIILFLRWPHWKCCCLISWFISFKLAFFQVTSPRYHYSSIDHCHTILWLYFEIYVYLCIYTNIYIYIYKIYKCLLKASMCNLYWSRKWQPTPVFLPGESQGRGSLVGCRLWGRTESGTTEVMQQQQQFISVQWLSHVWLFETPWTAAGQTSLSITNSWSLLRLISVQSVMPSNQLILCCPFLLLPQSFPASGSFPMSQLFASGGHWSSASVLPMNIQDWFHLEWTGWLSLQSKGLSRVFTNTTVQKHQFFMLSFLYVEGQNTAKLLCQIPRWKFDDLGLGKQITPSAHLTIRRARYYLF